MMELSSLELRSNLELEFGRMELDSFWNSRVFGTREFLELDKFLELESFWNLTTFWNSRVFGTRPVSGT